MRLDVHDGGIYRIDTGSTLGKSDQRGRYYGLSEGKKEKLRETVLGTQFQCLGFS